MIDPSKCLVFTQSFNQPKDFGSYFSAYFDYFTNHKLNYQQKDLVGSKFYKNEKGKNKMIKNKARQSVFGQFNGFKSENELLSDIYDHPMKFNDKPFETNFLYGIGFEHVLQSNFIDVKNNKIDVNVGGGFVPELHKKKFVSQNDTDENKLYLNILDFNSLYPTMMIQYNLCLSSLNIFTCWKVNINGVHHDPLDNNFFNVFVLNLKLETISYPVVASFTKPQCKEAVVTNILQALSKARKSYRKDQKQYSSDSPQWQIAEKNQLACKLLANAIYGLFNAINSPIFQPLVAAAITYCGRMSLIKLFFFSAYYFFKNDVNYSERKTYYGDTDSIFQVAKQMEMTEIIKSFTNLPQNKGIVGIEHEKSLDIILFLKKKNYVALNNFKIDDGEFIRQSKPTVYIKGLFKKSQTQPSKSFLSGFMSLLFKLLANPCEDYVLHLENLFKDYACLPEQFYSKNKELSRSLVEYKVKADAFLLQLLYGEREKNLSFPKKTTIEYSHYNCVFPFILDFQSSEVELNKFADKIIKTQEKNKKLKNIKQRKDIIDAEKLKIETLKKNVVGPIDSSNIIQKKYIEKKSGCTLLINDLKELFTHAQIDKGRIFRLDIETSLKDVLLAADHSDLTNHFNRIFQSLFNQPFFLTKLPATKKSTLGVKRKMDDMVQTKLELNAKLKILKRV